MSSIQAYSSGVNRGTYQSDSGEKELQGFQVRFHPQGNDPGGINISDSSPLRH